MAKNFKAIQIVQDDSLELMEVGNWSQKKYKLVGKYCDIFTSGMRNKWNLIYIDLFCGPGFVKNKQSGAILKNSALIAMSLQHKFNFYALNDFNSKNCEALETRIKRLYPNISYNIFNLDANTNIEEIIQQIPEFNNGKPDLFFCFLDPFSLNLNFETVRTLARFQSDFLILHALQMDARRNIVKYMGQSNDTVEKFLGNSNWRNKYQEQEYIQKDFTKFLSEEYDSSMNVLGYEPAKKEIIKNTQGNGIYYLAFYSKHSRGLDFFEKVSKGDNDQLELF